MESITTQEVYGWFRAAAAGPLPKDVGGLPASSQAGFRRIALEVNRFVDGAVGRERDRAKRDDAPPPPPKPNQVTEITTKDAAASFGFTAPEDVEVLRGGFTAKDVWGDESEDAPPVRHESAGERL